jgi:hypothetical protein
MIVLRGDDDKAIAAFDRCRKLRLFHLLAGIVETHGKLAHIDQFRFNARAFLRLLENKLRDVLAFAAPACRSENNGNEEWALCRHWIDNSDGRKGE